MAAGGRGISVDFDEAEFRRFTHGENSAVGRIMARAGEVVTQGAKRRAPVSPVGTNPLGSGHLRSSIGWQLEAGPDGQPQARISATADYALFVEVGTRPHVITAHGNYPLRDAKGRVFGRTVNHPGTPAQPYLRPALFDLARL